MSITLYHVSYDLDEPLHKEFVPKVPENAINDEDETIPRICLSDSIQGCMRSISGYPKTDSGYKDIIVWKHEFEEDDIYDWKHLYYNDLVPDASVTHEYWYMKPITLEGERYRISNIDFRVMYFFNQRYKEQIFQILSKYTDECEIFEQLDPCTIINEWVHEHLPSDEYDIIQEMKELIPDYDPTDMLIGFDLERI